MYVLNSVQAPNAVYHAVGARVLPSGGRGLVVVRPKTIEVYSGVRSLILEAVEDVDDRIVALAAIHQKGADRDHLAVLLELHTLLVWAYNDGFHSLYAVRFSDMGHQTVIDSDAFLVPDSAENTSFLVVHCFLGVVLVVFLEDPKPGSKRGSPSCPTKTFSIGNVVVHSLAMLQRCEKPTVAVLYRDFNFNFSLRYYVVDANARSFTLAKQFDEFDEPPTLLVAAPFGGVFLASDLHLFYFPNPLVSQVGVSVAKSDLLANNDRLVVTKKLYENGTAEFLSQTFVCHSVVDQKRILLMNDAGVASLLYVDMDSTSRTITVNSMEVIKLGMATVPSALVFLDSNVFFASSRLSQSVVFEVLPVQPHISICQFFPSSPPVLGIDIIKDGLLLKIIACQGGEKSGEIRKYANSDSIISKIGSIRVDPSLARVVLIADGVKKLTLGLFDVKNVLLFDCQVDLEETSANATLRKLPSAVSFIDIKRINGAHYAITESDIDIDDEVLEEKVTDGIILMSGAVFHVNKDNVLVLSHNSGPKQSHILSLSDTNLTSIDATKISKESYAVLVTFAGGDFEVVLFSNSSSTTLVSSLTEAELGIFASSLVHFPQTASLALIVLYCDGSVSSGHVNLKPQRKLSLHTVIKSQGVPFKMSKGRKGDVILFNRTEILSMKFSFPTNAFTVSALDLAHGANDVVHLNDSNIAVLRLSELEVFLLEAHAGTNLAQTIYSNDLKKRSYHVADTNYSVVIASESKLDSVSGELELTPYIQLINNTTMLVVHEYKTAENGAPVDIAFIPQTDSLDIPRRTFVSVNNTNDKDKTFSLFRIKKGKIIELPSASVQGLASVKDLILQSIVLLSETNLTFLVSGNTNFIIQLQAMGTDLIWKLHTNSLVQLPAFSIMSAVCNSNIIMGDIAKGLYSGTLSEDADSGELSLTSLAVQLGQEPTFLTAFDLKPDKGNNCRIIFGDSLGNISVVRFQNEEIEQIAAFNIGELVNVVRTIEAKTSGDFHVRFFPGQKSTTTTPTAVLGTVYGSLYSLSLVNSMDNYEILEQCIMELAEYVSRTQVGKKGPEVVPKRNSKNDWRTLRPDGSGQLIKYEHYGVIDIEPIRRWLIEEDQLRRQEPQSLDSSTKARQMKKQLPKCYRNKIFLQQLVHETGLI